MGKYLNPGKGSFNESIGAKIYVDNIGLISYTNEAINSIDKYICVFGPRGFGKIMAADMLEAY